MPKTSTRNALARQWEILKLLPQEEQGISVANLFERLGQQGFEVTLRTLQRDLQELAQSFSIEGHGAGKSYQWRWKSGSVLPEFTSLAATGDELTNKNSAESFHQLSSHFPLQVLAVDSAVLQAVQMALLECKQLSVRYLPAAAFAANELSQPEALATQNAIELMLHPLGLIQRDDSSYVLANSAENSKPALYALARMSSAELSDSDIETPAGFDLAVWLEKARTYGSADSSGPMQLKARVRPALAKVLGDAPLSQDQQLDMKTGILSATLTDSQQLHHWILAQGNEIEVIAPEALRKRVIGVMKQALYRYECDPAVA